MKQMKYFLLFCCSASHWITILSQSMGGIPTQSSPPIIVKVSPSFGSAEGGTQITITGTNFMQGGMFSQLLVYINNAPCNIINYFTFDTQITCVTPKCTTTNCLATSDYQGSETVGLSVYVQTVEGEFRFCDVVKW